MVLTSPAGFGLESATILQRLKCRAFDGVPTDDLLARASDFERRAFETAIGCTAAELPLDAPPTECADFSPVRTGKSLAMAALAVCRSQTITTDIIKRGEQGPRISVLATELDNANAIRGHLAMVHERPALRALKVGETSDGIVLRHPSGLPVEINVVAAKRGGYSLASRWSGSVIFDEAPGWYSTDRVVSLEDSREQALGRLLPGAQLFYAGSKWQPSGFCFSAYQEHFGKPTSEFLVISPQEVDGISPATQLNPAYWTPQRIQKIKRTSPRTFTMHVQNEFGSAGDSVLTLDEVNCATHECVPPGTLGGRWMCSLDASGLRHDTWAALFSYFGWPSPVQVRRPLWAEGPAFPPQTIQIGWATDETGAPIYEPQLTRPVLRVARVVGWGPPHRTSINAIVDSVAANCKQLNIDVVFADQFEQAALGGLFSNHGIRYRSYHWTQESKDAAIAGNLRRMFREGGISLVPHEQLKRQLLSIREVPAAGRRWSYPTNGLDYASALITLCHALNDPELGANDGKAQARVDHNPHAHFNPGRHEAPGL